jgi:hypothetical protein
MQPNEIAWRFIKTDDIEIHQSHFQCPFQNPERRAKVYHRTSKPAMIPSWVRRYARQRPFPSSLPFRANINEMAARPEGKNDDRKRKKPPEQKGISDPESHPNRQGANKGPRQYRWCHGWYSLATARPSRQGERGK